MMSRRRFREADCHQASPAVPHAIWKPPQVSMTEQGRPQGSGTTATGTSRNWEDTLKAGVSVGDPSPEPFIRHAASPVSQTEKDRISADPEPGFVGPPSREASRRTTAGRSGGGRPSAGFRDAASGHGEFEWQRTGTGERPAVPGAISVSRDGRVPSRAWRKDSVLRTAPGDRRCCGPPTECSKLLMSS
jgi:hypothetical protein